MATTDLIGTCAGVDQQGMSSADRAAHAAASHVRAAASPAPTSPLPPAAAEMLAFLIPHFPLVRAVAEYETAAVHAVQLAALAEADRMTDLDADSLAAAEDMMASARAVLERAGRLDLIGEA